MTMIRNARNEVREFDAAAYTAYIEEVAKEVGGLSIKPFLNRTIKSIERKEEMDTEALDQLSILNALSYMEREAPRWTFLAARLFLNTLYEKAAVQRGEEIGTRYGSFRNLIDRLVKEGIYTEDLMTSYSEAEMKELEATIVPERDHLFTYIGIKTLADRYLATDKDRHVFELPQERWMIIAMYINKEEPKDKRLEIIKEAYWAMSNLYMTVATPTMANAGKTYAQLSSCFIDTVEDDLEAIYDNNTDMAKISKNGGGIGVYMGKVRSLGSSIKGFKGISSGTNPWIRQLNNTAMSVDQLGQRKGAIAVYMDVWHKDVFGFLDAKDTISGDIRTKTPDIFLGVCLPDLFMEKVRDREEWHLFDPHEVREVMGYSIEDFYDEKKGEGSFRTKYEECVAHPMLSRETIRAIDLFAKIMMLQLKEGVPYMFYRDEVNRKNPNKHAGIIYSSNLCTEIFQNMSPTLVQEETLTPDGKIVVVKQAGDFVVCNLSSVSLAKVFKDDVLARVLKVQVRMLDNVIDVNKLPVKQATHTNRKYRAIGVGTYGWHHLLAISQIHWESDRAVEFADEVYEQVAYHTITASMELAKEKGQYQVFEGSDWHTSQYFLDRGYIEEKDGAYVTAAGHKEDWAALAKQVADSGLRNGYLMAVAPNSTTAKIAGSTDGIDPIFRQFFTEEKKDYVIPVTVPDLSPDTNFFYRSARNLDQKASIRQNAKRQRHIDQGISFNLYVQNDIKAKDLLELHMLIWDLGIKTSYYIRNTVKSVDGNEVDDSECEFCQ